VNGRGVSVAAVCFRPIPAIGGASAADRWAAVDDVYFLAFSGRGADGPAKPAPSIGLVGPFCRRQCLLLLLIPKRAPPASVGRLSAMPGSVPFCEKAPTGIWPSVWCLAGPCRGAARAIPILILRSSPKPQPRARGGFGRAANRSTLTAEKSADLPGARSAPYIFTNEKCEGKLDE
jgi:hypothetical protein